MLLVTLTNKVWAGWGSRERDCLLIIILLINKLGGCPLFFGQIMSKPILKHDVIRFSNTMSLGGVSTSFCL